jgi:hypothetical protein
MPALQRGDPVPYVFADAHVSLPEMRPGGDDFGAMKRCIVTAIAPDGRRTSCEVEAESRNRAVYAYNYQAVSDHNLIRPLPDNDTVFEVMPEGGELLRCTWAEVCASARREAARVHARQSRNGR